jgi:hypothetical protein
MKSVQLIFNNSESNERDKQFGAIANDRISSSQVGNANLRKRSDPKAFPNPLKG